MKSLGVTVMAAVVVALTCALAFAKDANPGSVPVIIDRSARNVYAPPKESTEYFENVAARGHRFDWRIIAPDMAMRKGYVIMFDGSTKTVLSPEAFAPGK